MSHAQDIERIIQQNWAEVAPIPSDRALACQLQTVRAALASVERDRARLERELAASRSAHARALREIDALQEVLAGREGVAA